MKILNIAVLLILVSLVSCTKKEEATLPKNDFAIDNTPQSQLIIGSWQLGSVGRIVTKSSSGCGGSSSSQEELSWVSTSLKENLDFKASGDFAKSTANDAVCNGTYKVSSGVISSKTGCAVDEQKQVIYTMNASSMIIEAEDKTFYRYEKK
jgi:hypothetical protein